MKIVNLISEEKKRVVLTSGAEMMFVNDAVEDFNIEEGDVVIARGEKELYMGVAKYNNGNKDSFLLLGDVQISYYFCNIS